MSTHEAIYDYLAERFRALRLPEATLDQLLLDAEEEGFEEVWHLPREMIVNAMRARDLDYSSGMIRKPDDAEPYIPVATDFRQFVKAAKTVLDEAEYPIDATTLIELTGLNHSAIPMHSMATHLRPAGIFHIPGIGFWRHRHYTTKDGRIISASLSEKAARIAECFERHGWPIVGPEVEAWTNGEVTSRYLVGYANRPGRLVIKGIGSGLYIPADQAGASALPMSRNVAEAMLALDPKQLIDDKDHLRLFRIALIMERLGLAEIKKSRTVRVGIRRQTMRVAVNKKGLAMLRKNARLTADEF